MDTKKIRVGERFDSFKQFEETLQKYEGEEFANYVKAKCDKHQGDQNLVYKNLRLKCKFFGQHTKTSNKRKTKTFKEGCGAFIYVIQKERNGVNMLEIHSMSEHHSHERSVDLYKFMPKQRKAAVEENKEKLQNAMAVKANLKALQKQVNATESIKSGIITLKDLHNFKATLKTGHHQNDLVKLIDAMTQIEGATIKVIQNEQQEVECIFFQDTRMKEMFNTYPELVMMDGTYKLNDRRMPLIVMLIVDGNGQSQIAGLCIVKSESDRIFRHMFDEFKAENPKHTEIAVIMSDKGSANVSAFKASFPNAQHQLCVFHVLQIFSREVTTQKRNLTPQKKDDALKILRQMVYAKTQEDYDEYYQRLRSMNCPQLQAYFDDNWHSIQEQWVGFHVNQHVNYENRTNNRLESLNQNIKSVVAKHSPLATFFDDLITCIASFNIERDYIAADSILRKNLVNRDAQTYDEKYAKLLTRYAYEKYLNESEKAHEIEFTKIIEVEAECVQNGVIQTVTDENCSCPFFRTMSLPCAHIIAFLNYHKEDAFKPSICANRWKRSQTELLSSFAYLTGNPSKVDLIEIQTNENGRRRKLTPNEKFNKAELEAKRICQIISEKSEEQYDEWLQKLKDFRSCAETNKLPDIMQEIEQGKFFKRIYCLLCQVF